MGLWVFLAISWVWVGLGGWFGFVCGVSVWGGVVVLSCELVCGL